MDKDSLVERLTKAQRRMLLDFERNGLLFYWHTTIARADLRSFVRTTPPNIPARQKGAWYELTDAGRQALKETSRG